MKIVLFASPGIIGPYILLHLCNTEHKVEMVVMPADHPQAMNSDIPAIASQYEIPVMTESAEVSDNLLTKIKDICPHVILVATYDKKIPAQLRDLASKAAINIHPSYLPKYRGACPEFWVLRNGETETGVSIHHLSDEFDGGNIIKQERIEIKPNDTVGSLSYSLAACAGRVLNDVLDALDSGNALIGNEQNNELSSKAPLVTVSDLVIDWKDSAESIVNLVRAANPISGAITRYRGFQLKVWHAEVFEGPADSSKLDSLDVGTIVVLERNKSVLVKSGKGLVCLKVVQLALYHTLDAFSFCCNLGVKSLEKLG